MPREKWKNIHKDFDKFGWEKSWKLRGFNYQETTKWINEGGLLPKHFYLATHLRENRITPTEFTAFSNKNAQEWLDHFYSPSTKRKTIYLDISNQKLEGPLNFDGFSILEELYCADNKITNLNLNNCTKLNHIDCPINKFTTLDFSDNLELEYLNCWNNNDLSVLDINKNSKIVELSCYECNLSRLDLKNNNKLKKVWCFSNQLTEVILPDFSQLVNFHCPNNNLTSLDFLNCLNPWFLEILVINDNNFSKNDLSVFSRFINLKILVIGSQERREKFYSNFFGSLKSLQNLTKLKILGIQNTDISEGIEYLPNSLEEFYCHSTLIPESLANKNIANSLESFREINKENYIDLLRKWTELKLDPKEYKFVAYLRKNRIDLATELLKHKNFFENVDNQELFRRWKVYNPKIQGQFKEYIEITKNSLEAF